MDLSNRIYRHSRVHKIPADLFTAILMQESGYNLSAKGCHSGLDSENNEVRVCADFGISQIYYKTARRFDLDVSKLTTDLDYSISAGAMILADFKRRYSKREFNWWTRYNSPTKTKREIYRQLVERFL